MEQFDAYLNERRLRHSKRREEIARIFFSATSHIGIEELFEKVHRTNSAIGIATVYRTLNLLVDAGLAVRRNFDAGAVVYEKRPDAHHDHLICTECRNILEFQRDEIEKLQEDVAASYGFELRSHKMELYGICKICLSKRRSKKRTGR